MSTEEKYGRESLVIPVDFSGDFDLYAPLADRLSQLDIGVLGKYALKKREGGREGGGGRKGVGGRGLRGKGRS